MQKPTPEKTVLITGCEGQLGQCFVKRLLGQEYNIIGFDIAPESRFPEIFYKRVDISKSGDIEAGLKGIKRRIDILINNAGTAVFTPFEERTEEELDQVIGVNLKGTILMTRAIFNQYFKLQKSGCIVNIGSIYGEVAGDMRIYESDDRRTPEIYGATKAGVIQLTKYFAAYMAPYNIRVNCLSPGGIKFQQERAFIDRYANKVPLRRMGEETELLSTLEYLISDDSSYVTGQNILVDGGLTVW